MDYNSKKEKFSFNLDEILNMENVLKGQVFDFSNIREKTKSLRFIPVEPLGDYIPITYISFDGGKLGIDFAPFHLDFVQISDSLGNSKMKFLVPKNIDWDLSGLTFLENLEMFQSFLSIAGENHLEDCLQFPPNIQMIMNIAETACIVHQLHQDNTFNLLILKDGLLRIKSLKPKVTSRILSFIERNQKSKVIGVAKRSAIYDLLSSAIMIENIFPKNKTGFVAISTDLERMAYKYSINATQYAWGKLYLAKLSPASKFLVTLEIPFDLKNNKLIYSESEIISLIGSLIKDSRYSYPTLGYPQTIMRAHEQAVQTGFTASVWKEKIINKLVESTKDEKMRQILIDAWYLKDSIKKPYLGGL